MELNSRSPLGQGYFVPSGLWIMNQVHVKQKAVSLEWLLILDNGKNPDECFPAFSSYMKI